VNNLHEILEICLKDIEQGADVETVLFRHPDVADELRPILEASVKAKAMAIAAPSQDVVRRNRAKLLQRAAEMREGRVKAVSRRIWSVPLRRALVTLMVLAMLFVSGTGLVRAASTTVPGDNLYPVKRTWEDLLLLFTFDVQKREALEVEHENERLEELHELFTEGRSAEVDFAGYVTSLSGNEWQVSGISVRVSPQTDLPDQQIVIGSPVRVIGQTQSDYSVLAEQIELLPPNAIMPEVEDDPLEEENEGGSNPHSDEDLGNGAGGEATETQKPESEPRQESFEGHVDSIDNENEIWTIDGQPADVSNAEIKGTPVIGAVAKVEGYFNADGMLIVTKIEFQDGGSDDNGNSGSGDHDNDNDNGGGNGNDDNSNNDNNNDNGDDHGGNSGSGGGGGGGDDD